MVYTHIQLVSFSAIKFRNISIYIGFSIAAFDYRAHPGPNMTPKSCSLFFSSQWARLCFLAYRPHPRGAAQGESGSHKTGRTPPKNAAFRETYGALTCFNLSLKRWCREKWGAISNNDRRKFRSETSDNMDSWKAEVRRVRREKIRRKKMQVR